MSAQHHYCSGPLFCVYRASRVPSGHVFSYLRQFTVNVHTRLSGLSNATCSLAPDNYVVLAYVAFCCGTTWLKLHLSWIHYTVATHSNEQWEPGAVRWLLATVGLQRYSSLWHKKTEWRRKKCVMHGMLCLKSLSSAHLLISSLSISGLYNNSCSY